MLKSVARNIFDKLGYEVRNKNSEPQVCYEIDKDFHALYGRAQEKCQMTITDNLLRRHRHYTLVQLLKNAPINEGDVCELGCWRGLSAYQLAHHLQSTGFQETFHIFDSFQGLSKYDDIDIPEGNVQDLEKKQTQFACSLEIVQSNLKDFNFIEYHQGWIPDRFNDVLDKKFSFVHIDVDLYQPIHDSIQYFYPKLVKGGVMVFDDYGYVQFPGAKKAVDQCLSDFQNPFFVALPSGQAFLVKKT